MNKCDEKRKSLNVYFNADERTQIELLAKRVGYKKCGELIRIAMLKLANDPSLDFIFDDGSLLKQDPRRIKLRSILFANIDKTIDLIEQNHLLIPGIYEDKEENDGS